MRSFVVVACILALFQTALAAPQLSPPSQAGAATAAVASNAPVRRANVLDGFPWPDPVSSTSSDSTTSSEDGATTTTTTTDTLTTTVTETVTTTITTDTPESTITSSEATGIKMLDAVLEPLKRGEEVSTTLGINGAAQGNLAQATKGI